MLKTFSERIHGAERHETFELAERPRVLSDNYIDALKISILQSLCILTYARKSVTNFNAISRIFLKKRIIFRKKKISSALNVELNSFFWTVKFLFCVIHILYVYILRLIRVDYREISPVLFTSV